MKRIPDARSESPLARQRTEGIRLLEERRESEERRASVEPWQAFQWHRWNKRWTLEFLMVSP